MVKTKQKTETKCFVFQQNNDNPYKIYNNCIKLSAVFHPIIFLLRNKKTKSLPAIFLHAQLAVNLGCCMVL